MAEKIGLADIKELSWNWRNSALMIQAHAAGVFEALAGGEWKLADNVAETLDADRRAVRLLLIALSGIGLVQKNDSHFRNSETAEMYLTESSPEYRGHLLELDRRSMSNWIRIPEVLKSGQPIPRPEITAEEKRTWQETFIKAMDALSRDKVEVVFNALPLNDGARFLDIGCGPGAYVAEFARRLPNLTAVAFDRLESERIVRQACAIAGVSERVTFIAGDFETDHFEYGPFDGVFLSQILHMVSPRKAADMVRRAARQTVPGGFVAIQEMTLGSDEAPGLSAVFAVQMMLGTTEGQVYTRGELESFLMDAGLFIESVSRVDDRSELVIGRKKD